MLKRQTKIGKSLQQLSIGEKLTITETITDKDLLLYLGLTNDSNPLYIQHDYANTTPFEKPIVPTILLNGIINTAVSKHLPGPGSHVRAQQLTYLTPVYHEETIEVHLHVDAIDVENGTAVIAVQGFNEQGMAIISGSVTVIPPQV